MGFLEGVKKLQEKYNEVYTTFLHREHTSEADDTTESSNTDSQDGMESSNTDSDVEQEFPCIEQVEGDGQPQKVKRVYLTALLTTELKKIHAFVQSCVTYVRTFLTLDSEALNQVIVSHAEAAKEDAKFSESDEPDKKNEEVAPQENEEDEA